MAQSLRENGPRSLGPFLGLAIFRPIQSGNSAASRESPCRGLLEAPCVCVYMRVSECEYGEAAAAISGSLRTLSQGWILSCRSLRPALPRGFPNPIVSFRFARAYPPSEPETRAGRTAARA